MTVASNNSIQNSKSHINLRRIMGVFFLILLLQLPSHCRGKCLDWTFKPSPQPSADAAGPAVTSTCSDINPQRSATPETLTASLDLMKETQKTKGLCRLKVARTCPGDVAVLIWFISLIHQCKRLVSRSFCESPWPDIRCKLLLGQCK